MKQKTVHLPTHHPHILPLQNLACLESLTRLDMTGTFVRAGTLRSSAAALAAAPALVDLALTGTPASAWPHYRPFLVLRLPLVRKLDGQAVKSGERVRAAGDRERLEAAAAAAEAEDAAARGVAVDAGYDADADDAAEAEAAIDAARALVDAEREGGAAAADGPRAWTRVTRIADAMVAADKAMESELKAKPASSAIDGGGDITWPRTAAGTRTAFPPLPADGTPPPQTNEGDWAFTLDVTPDEGAIEFAVFLGRGVKAGAVDAHISPRAVRVLAAGCLLCVHLPLTVNPDAAIAQRSAASGALVVRAPRALGGEPVDVALLRPAASSGGSGDSAQSVRRGAAAVVVAGGEDGDEPPPL